MQYPVALRFQLAHLFIVDSGANTKRKFLLLVWWKFNNRVLYSVVCYFWWNQSFLLLHRWSSRGYFPMKYFPFCRDSWVVAVGRFLLILCGGRCYSCYCVFFLHFLKVLYFYTCSLQMTKPWSLDVSVPLKLLAFMRVCLVFLLQDM